MPEISLTEFVDFVIKSGTPKLTQVRTIKHQHQVGYDPKHDYYRKLRDGVVDFHQRGLDKKCLDAICVDIPDKNKRNTYPLLVAAYKTFLGKKKITWFEPARGNWKHASLRVRINPELGLSLDGEDHLVKLYFKDLRLTKERIAIISHMMLKSLGASAEGMKVALLDVRNSRLHVFDSLDPALAPLLEGEALSFCRMYERA
jgi:hypothetical protein